MIFSLFKVEPKKHSSGAKERLLFFLATFVAVAFFSVSDVSASMNLDDFVLTDMTAEQFVSGFHANVPLVKGGLNMWDYSISEASGVYDYNVVLFTADFQYIAGDNINSSFFTSSLKGSVSPYAYSYVCSHRADNTGFYCYTGSTSQTTTFFGQKAFSIDKPIYSSQSVILTQSCDGNAWNTTHATVPVEYSSCGSWNNNCSPLYTKASVCGGELITTPIPPAETDLSCTFDFSAIPDWTDPFGMFTGFFTQLFGWFGCAFNSVGSWLHDSIVTTSMIVGDFFGVATDTIGGFFTTITSAISGFFVALGDTLGGWITGAVSSIAEFFTADWWGDIAVFVFAPNVILMDATINSQSDILHEKFPNFFQFYEDFGSLAPANASNVKIFEGDLSLNGQNAHMVFDPFHTLPIPEFIPTLLTALMYLSLGFWLLRNLSNLFPE